MIIIGYGSTVEEPKYPLIPDFVIVREDSDPLCDYVLSKDGHSKGPVGHSSYVPMRKELSVPEKHWVGVLEGGSVEVILLEEEPKWRIHHAARRVEESVRIKATDPIRSVACLHSAASLLDISLGSLIREISSMKKDPSESLADAFARVGFGAKVSGK